MNERFSSAAVAGTAYFGIVFAVGFALGTFRVLVLAPRIGEVPATFIELPIMLSLSWITCHSVVDRFAVPPRWLSRLFMGLVAFVLLMLGEMSVSVLGFGRTFSQHLSNYLNPLPAIGLAAQLLFALFPLLQAHR